MELSERGECQHGEDQKRSPRSEVCAPIGVVAPDDGKQTERDTPRAQCKHQRNAPSKTRLVRRTTVHITGERAPYEAHRRDWHSGERIPWRAFISALTQLRKGPESVHPTTPPRPKFAQSE